MLVARRQAIRHAASWLVCCSGLTPMRRAFPASPQIRPQTAEALAPKPQSAVDGSEVAYPLAVSSDKRYLVDQNQRPFFMVGDSAQSIYSSLSPEDLKFYLARRREQRFNTILAEPIHWDGDRAMASADGHLPFLRNSTGGEYDGTLGTADFSTPNPAYWDHVDHVLDQMQAMGFLAVQYVVSWGFDPALSGPWRRFVQHVIPGGVQHTSFWQRLESAAGEAPEGCGLWKDLINPRNTEAVCYAFGHWL